jgi:hypothetical protein
MGVYNITQSRVRVTIAAIENSYVLRILVLRACL